MNERERLELMTAIILAAQVRHDGPRILEAPRIVAFSVQVACQIQDAVEERLASKTPRPPTWLPSSEPPP